MVIYVVVFQYVVCWTEMIKLQREHKHAYVGCRIWDEAGMWMSLMAVDNRAPWEFKKLTDGERERPGTLFGTHLRPMGLKVLRYQTHLGIVAILHVPRRILLKVIAYVPYLNETIRCPPCNDGLLCSLLIKCKGMERQKGKSTPLFVEALQIASAAKPMTYG